MNANTNTNMFFLPQVQNFPAAAGILKARPQKCEVCPGNDACFYAQTIGCRCDEKKYPTVESFLNAVQTVIYGEYVKNIMEKGVSHS